MEGVAGLLYEVHEVFVQIEHIGSADILVHVLRVHVLGGLTGIALAPEAFKLCPGRVKVAVEVHRDVHLLLVLIEILFELKELLAV